MKGDKVVERSKKLGNLFLLGNLKRLFYIHFRNHFKADRINRRLGSHFHCSIVEFGREIIEEILPPNTLKIRHFIASLMQIKLAVDIVKNFPYISVANGYNCFAVVQIFVASNWNIRPDIKWILSIVYLVLCIAFSGTNRAYILRLTLFPRKAKEPRKASALKILTLGLWFTAC